MPKPSHHKKSAPRTSTRSGAEAAEGMKAVSGARADEPSSSNNREAQPTATPQSEKSAHPGTEPLEHRSVEHESGYGGKGGAPRVSSDEREKVARDGSLRSETKKR
jgi:hypothetical protein